MNKARCLSLVSNVVAAKDGEYDQKRVKVYKTTNRLLISFLKRNKKDIKLKIFLLFFCIILFKLSSACIPFLYGKLIDHVNTSEVSGEFIIPIGLVIGYGIARFLSNTFQYVQEFSLTSVSKRITSRLAINIFDHLHHLSHDFHLKNKSGALAQSVRLGLRAVGDIFSSVILGFIPLIIEFLFVTVVLLFTVNFLFVGVLILTSIFYFILAGYLARKHIMTVQRMNDAELDTSSHLIDSLINFEAIKYFSKQNDESVIFDDAWKKQEHLSVKSAFNLSMLKILQEWLFIILYVAFLLGALYQMKVGHMTVGQLVMVMTYLTELLNSLHLLVHEQEHLRRSLTDMKGIFSLLDEHPSIIDKKNAPLITIAKGEIKFENVSFGYSPDNLILKNIFLTIPAGKVIAIVGKTGAGKTTISRLIMRLYDVNSGSIKIDGQDIRHVTQSSLRSSIGIVPQDISLFNNTISFNIAYPNPKATQSQIEEAARLAHLHEFIVSLPEKYNTIVGERGLKLSGGEKQRIALARIMLKKPKIVVFDEATSSLDVHTEKSIQSSLALIKEHCTVVIIAHRLSTVTLADEIFVFDSGSIIEQGSHQALLLKNGTYATLWDTSQNQGLCSRGGC